MLTLIYMCIYYILKELDIYLKTKNKINDLYFIDRFIEIKLF